MHHNLTAGWRMPKMRTWLFAGVVGAALCGIATVTTQVRPQQVQAPRLYVLDCGVLKRGEPKAYGLTSAQVESTDFSDACYLIVHRQGTVLWDLGIIPDALVKPGGTEVPQGTSGNTNKADKTLKSQLAEIGYDPSMITYVAMSHAHSDHIANANDYAGSTWLVQKTEWDTMFSLEARQRPGFAIYSALENAKTTFLRGDYDVFGDGTVVLISTPGHTPGHQSLFVKLANTGSVLLSGDLYHYPAERTLKKVPANDNKEQTQASRDVVDALVQKTGGQLWIQHDIIANAKLKKSPQYYD